MSQRPNVDVRILNPATAPSAVNGFELLYRQGDVKPFLAVTASVAGPHYFDVDDQVAKFVRRFDHLEESAVPPAETIQRIQQIRETHMRETYYR